MFPSPSIADYRRLEESIDCTTNGIGFFCFDYDPELPSRPSQAKRNAKLQPYAAKNFCDYTEEWFRDADFADSTKAMRRGIYNRDIHPCFKKRLLTEVTEDEIRALCERIKARNAPATALHVRDVIKAVFDFAALKGLKIKNPAANIAPKAIATIKPRDRALSALEVRIMLL